MTGSAKQTLGPGVMALGGSGAMAIPSASLYGFLAGHSLGSVDFLGQIIVDEDMSNDFLASWGKINLPILGSQLVGLKFNLNDFSVSPILNANDVPKTNSFDVNGTEDWLTISATWDNAMTGPVATRMRTPENTFIQEADYAANGITLVDFFSGSTAKTVVIDHPRGGNWDLQVIDTTGFSNLHYRGYTPNPSATVALTGASLVPGATKGTIDAVLTGADKNTKVGFYADTDASGFDGLALGTAVRDADGAFTFTFDTAALAGGTYHAYAIALDNMGAPGMAYGGTFSVAHQTTDITLSGSTVIEDALPGTAIATLGAVNTDASETHAFSLVDDAGGRFAILGTSLVVGTGAPLDAATAPAQTIVIRETTGHGLTFDETVTIQVSAVSGTRQVQHGDAGIDVLNGLDGPDVFFNVVDGDTAIGRGDADVVYLNGNRADYFITVDLTGILAGPVRAFAAAGLPSDVDISSPLDPAPPYFIVQDTRTTAAPVILSGIETLQFRDTRLAAAAVACFARGTRIATDRGMVAVEDLIAGDSVRTALGDGWRPIVWIGHRDVDCANHPNPEQVWPIRAMAGALGQGLPVRDLYLSPDHAVYLDGVLLPVKYLENGTTIRQIRRDAVSYFHVELTGHDVLFAEGLPAESYLETGGRADFANGGEPMTPHPVFSQCRIADAWEYQACAPLVLTGPLLDAVRTAHGLGRFPPGRGQGHSASGQGSELKLQRVDNTTFG